MVHPQHRMRFLFLYQRWVTLVLVSANIFLKFQIWLSNSWKWPTWRTVPFFICLFKFCTCFEQPRAHHLENQLYQYNIWYVSLCVSDRLVCRSGCSFPTCIPDGHLHEWHIPDVLLIQLIFLMMSTRLLETCRDLKETYRKRNCVSSWSFTRIILRCMVNRM
jgi:hypothetical protein